MLVRVDEFWPDHDPETTHKFWVDLNKMTGYTQVLRAGTSRNQSKTTSPQADWRCMTHYGSNP
jgi:hypothetical protein